jgi:hypothetical protein
VHSTGQLTHTRRSDGAPEPDGTLGSSLDGDQEKDFTLSSTVY